MFYVFRIYFQDLSTFFYSDVTLSYLCFDETLFSPKLQTIPFYAALLLKEALYHDAVIIEAPTLPLDKKNHH